MQLTRDLQGLGSWVRSSSCRSRSRSVSAPLASWARWLNWTAGRSHAAAGSSQRADPLPRVASSVSFTCDVLFLFFERTPNSIAQGRAFVQRIFARTDDRDKPVSLATRDAQIDAIAAWASPTPPGCTGWPASRSPPWSPTATATS